MKKILRHLFLSVAAVMAFSACQEAKRNTEELTDPWLRERTPVNVRLESQIGPAVISQDWRTDELGSVVVPLIPKRSNPADESSLQTPEKRDNGVH